jgi:hypothetical protein
MQKALKENFLKSEQCNALFYVDHYSAKKKIGIILLLFLQMRAA